jgi:hypothetical protein
MGALLTFCADFTFSVHELNHGWYHGFTNSLMVDNPLSVCFLLNLLTSFWEQMMTLFLAERIL